MGTQNEVAERYGPQTAQIEALLDRVRNLSGDEKEALRDAWTARADARADALEAWVAAWTAARVAGRAATWDAAWYAAWVVRTDAWDAAPDAVRHAMQALLVRDLIGQNGFTQEHYDTLVGPWESVMGTEWTRETL